MSVNTAAIIQSLRARRYEGPKIEVKEAVGGAPKSILETLSAFANDSGGTILLGLTDPDKGVLPAPNFSPERVMSQVEDMVRSGITPPVSAEITVETLQDGERIVRIDVEEGNLAEKPYYITTKGRYAGSYTRPGEGDRKLTSYEIDRLLENRRQPLYDREPVLGASLEDLDPDLVKGYLKVIREREMRAFAGLTDEEALLRSNVLVRCEESSRVVPTLAGLLALGSYPQSFFPQLDLTVVVLPTPNIGETAQDGSRFLDNQQCSGAIPYMVSDAIRVLIRNMRSRSVISSDGIGRENRYEYPIEVIRELLANALMHRDYSEQARGAQVQVELYPDRLVVRNAGGIYGAVNPADFGGYGVSSSRNSVLTRILSTTPLPDAGYMVAENRGSGIPSIFHSLKNAGMQMPAFRVTLNEVEVTVPHSALMGDEIKQWLKRFDAYNLSANQTQVLALMHSGRSVSNQNLQAWGIHPADATKELSDLVDKGLIVKHSDRRWSTYSLLPEYEPSSSPVDISQERDKTVNEQPKSSKSSGIVARRTSILSLVLNSEDGLSSQEIVEGLSAQNISVSRATINNDINYLIRSGNLSPTAAVRSKNRKYTVGERITVAD